MSGHHFLPLPRPLPRPAAAGFAEELPPRPRPRPAAFLACIKHFNSAEFAGKDHHPGMPRASSMSILSLAMLKHPLTK